MKMTWPPNISIQPYYSDDTVAIYHGDCLEVLPLLKDVTAVVTDPPYGLGFMGQYWDYGSPGSRFWELIAASSLPGAPLLSFGGTRTYHRLVSAIEDAGWEIRDCLMWIYGSGFPKSLDVGKAIDKLHRRDYIEAAQRLGLVIPGNSLHDWTKAEHSPSDKWWEEFKAYLPHSEWQLLEREVTSHDNRSGPNAFFGNIDGSDGFNATAPATPAAQLWDGYGTALKPAYEPIVLARKPLEGTVAQNVQKYGTGALWIDGGRVPSDVSETQDREGEPSAQRRYTGSGATDFAATPGPRGGDVKGRWPSNLIHDGSDEVVELFPDSKVSGSDKSGKPATGDGYDHSSNVYSAGVGNKQGRLHNDSGSAVRFFYAAKASTSERNDGLEDVERNNHPTVKPLALMRYLITLIIQPERNLILDPFMGSGTTLRAAKDLGLKIIGIEVDKRYCQIAVERMTQMTMSFGEGEIDAS